MQKHFFFCFINRYHCLQSSFDLCVRCFVYTIYFSLPASVTRISSGIYSLNNEKENLKIPHSLTYYSVFILLQVGKKIIKYKYMFIEIISSITGRQWECYRGTISTCFNQRINWLVNITLWIMKTCCLSVTTRQWDSFIIISYPFHQPNATTKILKWNFFFSLFSFLFPFAYM